MHIGLCLCHAPTNRRGRSATILFFSSRISQMENSSARFFHFSSHPKITIQIRILCARASWYVLQSKRFALRTHATWTNMYNAAKLHIFLCFVLLFVNMRDQSSYFVFLCLCVCLLACVAFSLTKSDDAGKNYARKKKREYKSEHADTFSVHLNDNDWVVGIFAVPLTILMSSPIKFYCALDGLSAQIECAQSIFKRFQLSHFIARSTIILLLALCSLSSFAYLSRCLWFANCVSACMCVCSA